MTEKSASSAVYDLAIVGGGFAGLAAGVFAATKGVRFAGVGTREGLSSMTGYLDMLGRSSTGSGYLHDPESGMAGLSKAFPDHPYMKSTAQDRSDAFDAFLGFLADAGLPHHRGRGNMLALSPIGGILCTHAVPASMLPGLEAFAAGTPCLLADFAGLPFFSSLEVAGLMRDIWPLTPMTCSLSFDARSALEMALRLEEAEARAALADELRRFLAVASSAPDGAPRCVGLPAMLGLRQSSVVLADLTARLGMPVFEVPTLPAGVPGLRLAAHVEAAVQGKGGSLYLEQEVFAVRMDVEGFSLDIGGHAPERTIRSRSLLLASGRFRSGGLAAEENGEVRERLLHLPVSAPAGREMWHDNDYFTVCGHRINQAGLLTDADFRPVNAKKEHVHPRLFAAGAILAGHDQVRERSGAGISLVSAWKAVNACARLLQEG